MKRVYVSEHKRQVQEVGYELAQAKQRFDNAFDWYCSNPLEQHLLAMKQALLAKEKLVEKLVLIHAEFEPEMMRVADPERL